jgi:hypothetical protein
MPSTIHYSLGGWLQKALFVLAVGGPAALIGWKASEIAFASLCTQVGTVPALHLARAADPRDPEIYYRLAQARLYDFMNCDPSSALADLQQAANLAPGRPVYWESVALALESRHEYRAARAALEHALSLEPMSPRAHWLAANCDLAAGETAAALPELKEVLKLGPSYSKPVFNLCLRTGVDPQTVERRVLPAANEPALLLEYAAFLVSQGQVATAKEVWNDAVAKDRSLTFSAAGPYVDGLIRENEYSNAYQAWGDLERLGVIRNPHGGDATELVFNGGFEREPLNAGFDWHYDRLPYLQLDFADPDARQGHRCLRIGFTAPSNSEYIPVYEDVPTLANQRYLLTAFVRSEGLTSDSGPRLRVVDLAQPTALDASTEQTLGTTAWHQLQLRFVTGSNTQFVRVFIYRQRSRDFPAEISGAFWIDEVSLRAAA